MPAVLRGYAKAKDGNLVLSGAMPILTGRTNRPRGGVGKRAFGRDEALRSLESRLLARTLLINVLASGPLSAAVEWRFTSRV